MGCLDQERGAQAKLSQPCRSGTLGRAQNHDAAAGGAGVAAAPAAHILLISGTSSLANPREDLAAGEFTLSPGTLAELEGITAYVAHQASGDRVCNAARRTASARL